MKSLYHIHRLNNYDSMWSKGNVITITDEFDAEFFKSLKATEYLLRKRYKDNYDIDFIIHIMEEMKLKNKVLNKDMKEFDLFLLSLYFLRRELALEEGRKIYNKEAPSRLHSIYLTRKDDLKYWTSMVGREKYKIYRLQCTGNLFESSDIFFSDKEKVFDEQIEESVNYWKPKKLVRRKEILFQGNAKIIK